MNSILNRLVGNISPAALLVSSFFWSWFDVVPFSPALFVAKESQPDSGLFTISFFAGTVFLVLCASNARFRTFVLKPRAFAGFSIVCGSLGTMIVYLGIQGNSILFFAGCVLVGVYQGAGIILVGSIATCEGTTNALVHLAAALPFNIVSILLVMFLQPLASVVFIIMLPLLPTVFFGVYLSREQNRTTLQSVTIVARATPSNAKGEAKCRLFNCTISFLLIVLIATIALGFVNYYATIFTPSQTDHFDYIPIVWRAITSSVVLAGYLFLSWRPYSILRVGLLLMAVGLVVVGIAPAIGWADTPLLDSPIFVGFACFDLLIWSIIIIIRYKSGTSLLQIICIVESLDEFGMLIGTTIGLQIGTQSNLMVVAYVVLGFLLLVAMQTFFSGTTSIQRLFKKQEVSLNNPSINTKDADVSLTLFTHHENVSKLATRYFLTSRETEVLTLLFAGRSVPYISEYLHVSDNTIKTHTRHIYTKLDVHNRQELLDLIS